MKSRFAALAFVLFAFSAQAEGPVVQPVEKVSVEKQLEQAKQKIAQLEAQLRSANSANQDLTTALNAVISSHSMVAAAQK